MFDQLIFDIVSKPLGKTWFIFDKQGNECVYKHWKKKKENQKILKKKKKRAKGRRRATVLIHSDLFLINSLCVHDIEEFFFGK
jgi:hypothetical protein